MTEMRHHIIIKSFEAKALKKRPFAVKFADFLTSFFGTVTFLSINVLFYVVWVLINAGKIPGIPVFDPFPYSFMNSFVSLEAIALTTIVLMSQNRQNERATLRNEFGLQVELISEKEITKALKLLKELAKDNKDLKDDPELLEMTKEIDASYIERRLQEEITKSENSMLKVEEKIEIKK